LHRSILAEVFKDPSNYEIVESVSVEGDRSEAYSSAALSTSARFAV
jgi:hypothetical protein